MSEPGHAGEISRAGPRPMSGPWRRSRCGPRALQQSSDAAPVFQAPTITIRDARPEDAVAACACLRASIEELCAADHNNDPETLRDWLANKTPVHVRLWISSPANHIYLAEIAEEIVGIGALSNAGEVTLLYVAPKARFQGVSKLLMERIEQKGSALAFEELTLVSTTTAHRFYTDRGYAQAGAPVSGFGTAPSYPMKKRVKG